MYERRSINQSQFQKKGESKFHPSHKKGKASFYTAKKK